MKGLNLSRKRGYQGGRRMCFFSIEITVTNHNKCQRSWGEGVVDIIESNTMNEDAEL